MTRLLATLASAFVLAGCGAKEGADDQKVRTAWAEYDKAFRSGNLEAVKNRVTGERAAELASENAPNLLELASKMRPADARIVRCQIAAASATLDLEGTMDGTRATATISLLQEKGEWRVAKESWTVKFDLSASPAAPEAPPPPEEVPAALRGVVDQVAASDPVAGAKAWADIGARYQSAAAFLAQIRPALWDQRPVQFVMVEESFKNGKNTFRYFTSKVPDTGGTAVRARTVGESLRYHLWQYEDVSNSGFKGSFADWWATYAPPKGLPAFAK